MEKFPNRREANKTNYEQLEIFAATQALTECGFLQEMSSLDLYHGRGGDGTPWRVDPSFDNAGNHTGHANINKTPALNTSHLHVAKSFADERASHSGLSPEVHRIISRDKDAKIIDLGFDIDSLDSSEKSNFKSAIRKTLPSITEGVPIDFSERETLENISPRDFLPNAQDGLFYDDDIEQNANHLHLNKNFSHSLMSAMNTRKLLAAYPKTIHDLMLAYMYDHDEIEVNAHGVVKDLPISREYLANWFRRTHIVGCKMSVRSATLGGQIVDNYLLFDLEKVNTTAEEERRNKLLDRRLGKIARAAEKNQPSESRLVANLENDYYIKPESILALAKETPGYREIFEADAGNWEKFTLEEHTETVLRLFDDNYADIMPASTLPIMRMALLVHDIGKSEAARQHDKQNQRAYNLYYAEDFMRKNKISSANQKLILSMIGTGSDYAASWGIDHDPEIDQAFFKFCKKTMQDYLGTKFVDKSTVTGFRDMLMVLQTCDSAAYTTMAVTRSAKNGVRYRNYGSFDESFEPFHGLTGHRVKLK